MRVWAEYAGGDFGGTVNGAQWEAGNVTGCSLGWTAGDLGFSRPVEGAVERAKEEEEEEGGGGGRGRAVARLPERVVARRVPLLHLLEIECQERGACDEEKKKK